VNFLARFRGAVEPRPAGRGSGVVYGIAEGHAGPLTPQPLQDARKRRRGGLFSPWCDVHGAYLPAIGENEGERREHCRVALDSQGAVLPAEAAIVVLAHPAAATVMSPAFSSSAISAVEMPYSARISRPCSPTSGAGRSMVAGVSLILTAGAMTRTVPATGCS
jgi:hypothetical protein